MAETCRNRTDQRLRLSAALKAVELTRALSLPFYNSIIKHVKPPDLIIYLRNYNIGKLVNNIEKRDRKFEKSIQIKYLRNLNNYYEEWMNNYSLGKLLIIDVSKIDFMEEIKDLESIINKVDIEINGLF